MRNVLSEVGKRKIRAGLSIATLICAIAVPVTPSSAVVTVADPVLYWGFNSSDSLTHESVTGQALAKVGAPAWANDGVHGGVLRLDGSSYLDGSAITFSDLPVGNKPYTVAAWIKPTVLNDGGIIGWGLFGQTLQVNAFRLYGDGIVNYWWDYDLSISSATHPLWSGIDIDTWSHVAVTYDGTTRALYVNGSMVESREEVYDNNAVQASFSLGKTAGSERFQGDLDDITVYDQALNAAQIGALKVSGPGQHIDEQGLDLYFSNGISSGTETTVPASPCAVLEGVAVDYNWGSSSPSGCNADQFSGYAYGKIVAPYTGTVSFCTANDDGMRLQLETSTVINSWNDQGPRTCNASGNFDMVAGNEYPLRLWYYENGGGAVMRLKWKYGSLDDFVAVPRANLMSSPATRVTITASDGGHVFGQTPGSVSYTAVNDATGATVSFGDGDTGPTCAAIDGDGNAVTATTSVSSTPYATRCSGAVQPGVTFSYVDGEWTVRQATTALTYTGTQGLTSLTSFTLDATVTPSACDKALVEYRINGETVSGTPAIAAGTVYEIEAQYPANSNCTDASQFAITVGGSTNASSTGGGTYNVPSAGRVNFGYTVQLVKRNGVLQPTGQILWTHQNGKVKLKGSITGFTRLSVCASGASCGIMTGTAALQRRQDDGTWLTSTASFAASVLDGGSSTVCTDKKSSCSTVLKPDKFAMDIAGLSVSGETVDMQTLTGGNLVIR